MSHKCTQMIVRDRAGYKHAPSMVFFLQFPMPKRLFSTVFNDVSQS